MKRRAFVLGGTVLALGVRRTRAQDKLRRVGWLTGGSPKSHAKLLEAFREGMKEHGWVEGRNYVLELRWAAGDNARLPVLAQELVQARPAVIVTAATIVHLAMRKATSTIPIVMATGADPVESGLAASLSRPGGNVTGVSGFFEQTPIKMLELAAGVVPAGSPVSLLVDVNTPFSREAFRERARAAARAVGLRAEFVDVASVEDVSRVLRQLADAPPAALIALPSPMFFYLAKDMAQRVAGLGRPVIYPFEESAEAGGLMSYAAPLADSYRRAARYVDLILRGANPAELPIEQPTRLALTINLRTARAQGIAIPRHVMLRADRVIE